jgi:phosphoribosylformylglycinamidine cyclo-ligase
LRTGRGRSRAGGLPGNLDRAIPSNLDAVVESSTWEIPTLFSVMQDAGNVPRDEMFRVFNMGVGMVVIAPPEAADEIIGSARVSGVVGWKLGELTPGTGEVHIV